MDGKPMVDFHAWTFEFELTPLGSWCWSQSPPSSAFGLAGAAVAADFCPRSTPVVSMAAGRGEAMDDGQSREMGAIAGALGGFLAAVFALIGGVPYFWPLVLLAGVVGGAALGWLFPRLADVVFYFFS